jgi:Glu-tRNA(Gln) amidotransferase subunit E-like FAD-binding protein
MTRHVTVVYAIRNEDANVVKIQKEHFRSMMSAYEDKNQPLAISGMALSDILSALDEIEELVRELGDTELQEAVEEILSSPKFS